MFLVIIWLQDDNVVGFLSRFSRAEDRGDAEALGGIVFLAGMYDQSHVTILRSGEMTERRDDGILNIIESKNKKNKILDTLESWNRERKNLRKKQIESKKTNNQTNKQESKLERKHRKQANERASDRKIDRKIDRKKDR